MDATHSFAPLLIVLLIAFAVPIFLSRIKHLSIPIVVGEIVAGMIVGRSRSMVSHRPMICSSEFLRTSASSS